MPSRQGFLVAGWSRCGGLRAVLCGVAGQLGGGKSLCALKMLTKWSHPTRLETRIKECHIRASTEVDKTSMRNESEGVHWYAEVGPPCKGRAPSTDLDFFERFEYEYACDDPKGKFYLSVPL